MPDSFTCPYCNSVMPCTPDTVSTQYPSFERPFNKTALPTSPLDKSALQITFYRCPKCAHYSIHVKGYGSAVQKIDTFIKPVSMAKQFPDYIPRAILDDYEEACAIVTLSPKASATLSRRCLQGMIRDFWGISGKKRLIDEIEALQDKVPPTQWKVLDSLRRIGNIGAHPENDINLIIDIEPTDAKKLIAVIELLIKQWYIERHEQEQLYQDILFIDQETQSQKVKG